MLTTPLPLPIPTPGGSVAAYISKHYLETYRDFRYGPRNWTLEVQDRRTGLKFQIGFGSVNTGLNAVLAWHFAGLY